MDIETAEAIEHLGRRVDATEASFRAELGAVRDDLRAEIGAVRDDLRVEIGAVRDDLRAEIGAVRDELRAEIRAVRDDLRGEFRDGLAENRRHSEILSESLRDDIRILAEGFATLSAKLDSRHH